MKVAIVDDQKELLITMNKRLRQLELEFIEVFSFLNINEMEKTDVQFDLIFLDIDMPDFDGIQYSRNHLERNFIFLSKQKDKMQDSFGPNIYGFINKADSFDKYKKIIEGAISRMSYSHKLMLKTDNGIQSFEVSEIIYLQYIDNRVIGMVYKNKGYSLFGYC